MPVQITILGLGRVGASIGLALNKIKDQVTRVGNDRDPGLARLAEKQGAVDKTMINLPASVREADVVIMALPVDEIRTTMEVIAQDLKPGCVLINTAPIVGPVIAWARELFPGDDRYFVSLTPTINPAYILDYGADADTPHADLFHNSLMLITTLPGIDESAIELATNLVQVLGAAPLFGDAVEADGLMAYSQVLPSLVSAALINATTGQPGWREARKMAGQMYAQATEAAMHPGESKEYGKTATLNADNTVRMLDQVMIELRELRDEVAAGKSAELQERLERAQASRDLWLHQRRSGDWEPKQQQRIPTGSEVIGRLFGVRPKKDKEQR